MLTATILIALLSLPVLVAASYLFVLTLLSRRAPPPAYGDPHLRFDVIVPAHDEEIGIASTVASLRSVDYPADLFRVIVVADNCTDATAARAEEAGARVIVRTDPNLRGKGYALKLAFDHSLADGLADAVVVVDADTLVTPNLLRAFAARYDAGAKAAQAEYGVRNPNASWRTRLMVIALATFHGVRSLGRERLRVSSGLRGNGMSFSREVIAAVPHEAFSLVEDLEYGMRLARAGYAVRYVPEARVAGEMVSSESASRSQRRRWEGGRVDMIRRHGWALLKEAFAKRDRVVFDVAMDILVPPLAYLVGLAFLGTTAAVACALLGGRGCAFAIVPWAVAVAMIVSYVLRGLVISETGLRGLLDLAWAPVYIAWKLALSLSNPEKRREGWVRTAREDDKA
ncbi:MAG TPA: glycosyltransferase family 2 protein [Polyangiaceae bacterium]|jgi:1,2-diacylglycerol 3-beta-glucosyltransferase|nr:glycosyltransferase family 2 protein [Polyangiaceae bacterium]